MSLTEMVRTSWRQFFGTGSQSEHQQLLEGLCEQYRAEAGDAAQFTAHARLMYYPHFRDRLLRIATEEWEQVQRLREQILTLGGEPPELPSTFSPRLGRNSWACLMLDLEEEKRSCTEMRERVRAAIRADPRIAEGLRHIRTVEQRHHEEIRAMIMKSDPNTPPAVDTQDAEAEKQKQEWLAQQKLEWFDRQRAEWESQGKPVPWAAWMGELEHRWLVNQVPNYELAWARRLIKQETGDDRPEYGKSAA